MEGAVGDHQTEAASQHGEDARLRQELADQLAAYPAASTQNTKRSIRAQVRGLDNPEAWFAQAQAEAAQDPSFHAAHASQT